MLLWMRARERAVSPLWALLNTFTPYKENQKLILKQSISYFKRTGWSFLDSDGLLWKKSSVLRYWKYSNLKAYIFVKFSLLNNRLQFNTSYL